MILISIIIPVYNTEQYLRQCCDSILALDNKNYEVILVDDGSIDSSGAICDEYAKRDSRFSVIHTSNHGASHARNVGIELARGEWISFVDSDDWIANDYLDFLSKKYHEDLIYFFLNQTYPNGDKIIRLVHNSVTSGRESVERELSNLKYGKLGDVFGWTVNKFFKKEIIDAHSVRFPEDIVFREDEVFTMTYCRYINSLRIMDTPLYYYRMRDNGLTAAGIRDEDMLKLAIALENNLPFYHNNMLMKEDMKRIANYYYFNLFNKIGKKGMKESFTTFYSFFNEKPLYKQFLHSRLALVLLSNNRSVSFMLLLIYSLFRLK